VKNRRKLIVGGLALVCALGIVATVIVRAYAGAPDVATVRATRETLSVSVTVSGKTEAGTKSDVFPTTAGTLKRVLVAEGQRVKAGQPLAELDTEQLDAAVERAQAAYAAADSQIDGVDAAGPTKAEREAASEQVSVARRAYEDACSAVDRLSAAPRASVVATLAAAERARDQAHAAYLSAKAQRGKLNADNGLDAQRRSARAQRKQASVALRLAKKDRDRATLTAPIDGVALFNEAGAPGAGVKPTAGCAVSPAAAPFSIVRLEALRFNAQADEADVARIKPGAKATVSLDAFPGHDIATKVSAVRPDAVLTSTGGTAFPVLLTLAGSGKDLRIGMTGNVTISIEDVKDAVTVPVEALFEEGGASHVFVVRDGKLARRVVTTGTMTDTKVQITKGLAAGETVALPSGKLTDGMAVKTGDAR
jgi:RND family efflux transporter MFP subunit